MTCSELRLSNPVPETIVWAYAFELTHTKEGSYLSCKPTKGKVICGRTQAKHDSVINSGAERFSLSYFVPFKKDGVNLSWSKAVELSSRKYAFTEEECNQLYNKSVDKAVNWLRSRADECEALKV